MGGVVLEELRVGMNVIISNWLAYITLAGVAQWVEHQPANQKVTGLIPSQGTCLGCRPGPCLGPCERQLIVSFPLSPSLALSLEMNFLKILNLF